MKTETITDSFAHDQCAQAIACGTMPLGTLNTSLLIHAARYCGCGWNPDRRSEIVREIRTRLLP